VDVLDGGFDAAVVISNDSDLWWPGAGGPPPGPGRDGQPGSGYTAGHPSGVPEADAGQHWWRTLRAADFTGHQLPNPAGKNRRPVDWQGIASAPQG